MPRVGAVTLAILLGLAGPLAAEDARAPAVRTAAERDFILAQMRLFLSSVQAILGGLAEGDTKRVVTEASARGRKGTPLSEIPPGLKAKETPAWGEMMGGARAGFDQIAAAAASGATTAQLIGLTSETMHYCVACHQSYRIVQE
jgi:hypothetical protein